MEQEIHRIWMLISELSDQLAQNNRVAADLHAQIQTLKEQADSNSKTTPLHRYNTDVSTELFDSELERSTVALIMENQGLLQENKQLTTLLTEYESTLETVMTKFRQHAQIVADKRSALRVHYEHVLATGEGQSSTQTYNLFTLQQSMERLRKLLDLAIKNESGQGEDADPAQSNTSQAGIQNPEEGDNAGQEQTEGTLNTALEGLTDGVDWAMEREAEIARLTKENQEIRKELGILEDIDDNKSDRSSSPLWSQMHSRSSSAPFGSGFTTMPQMPSPQPSPLVPNPFSPAYPGAQGYNPPGTLTQPDRRFGLPNRTAPMGPAPPQMAPRNTLGEGSLGGRQPPAFPNFFRGAPPARERLDLAGGQPPLL
ncbi:hypothetical protein CPB86DRAFT_692530 [Serendipita vermifera]|nr:hypothetical protein CPB86DRAFT_692530 [Serendipita vermifera]